MIKVWIVQRCCDGGYSIAGIFSSKDKAQKFCEKMGGVKNYYFLPEEYILDQKDKISQYENAIDELKSYAENSFGQLSDSFKLAIEALEEAIKNN